jgi:hypothetical protein
VKQIGAMGAAVQQGLIYATAIVVAKVLGLDHWSCFGTPPDPDVYQRVRANFERKTPTEQIAAIRNLASYFGVAPTKQNAAGFDDVLQTNLHDIKERLSLTWKEDDMTSIFVALHFAIDVESARRRHLKERVAEREAERTQAPKKSPRKTPGVPQKPTVQQSSPAPHVAPAAR